MRKTGDVTIRNLRGVQLGPELESAINKIFFETSATQSFSDEAEREVFRERWLGRYLRHYADHFYLACGSAGDVGGYLAGCHDDPARVELFADIPYFAEWSALTAEYPAHLHVNVADGWRNAGVGSLLVDAFVTDARHAGVRGVHVVTSRGMRNVDFYTARGFTEIAALRRGDRELLFLGQALGP